MEHRGKDADLPILIPKCLSKYLILGHKTLCKQVDGQHVKLPKPSNYPTYMLRASHLHGSDDLCPFSHPLFICEACLHERSMVLNILTSLMKIKATEHLEVSKARVASREEDILGINNVINSTLNLC